MQTPTRCLPDDEFKLFIAAELPEQRLTEVEAHLSTCDACREALESTVGDRLWWNDLEQALGTTTLSTTCDHEDQRDQIAEDRTQLLELLGPTDDPAMLGRIGSYEIVALLGQGGMGAVFKAFDRSLNRFVAIKLLLPHLASSGAARKRFSREAQAAAAVVDDHVMAIHGVSQWRSVPYFVMPYSRGVSLQKRLSDEGPLELREILRIGMQAARGLAAAHAQGLVHRDVKPANIFLDEGVERVQLMDFGLARAVDDASLTRSGMLAGTPQYMSPEQARAETVDHRSDLFSLGSVLYAMCTGHAPFRAESSYGVLRLITDKEPRPIREVNPDISEWLCTIIGKLMNKRPEQRFESAAQVAELLEDCLAHAQQPTSTPLPKIVTTLAVHHEHVGATAPRYTRLRLAKYIGTAAFVLSLLFAGILITLEWNKGTLTIDCAADDIPIRIMQGSEVVQRLTVSRQGTNHRIAAGNYVVELDGDLPKLSVENGVVTLARGDTVAVTIKWIESDGVALADDHNHTHDDIDDHSHNQLPSSVNSPSKLLVINDDSQPVAVDAVVRAEYFSGSVGHWSRFPESDKTISLAGLPPGKNILVTQPQHDVVTVVSPSNEAITIRQVKPGRPDRFEDVAITVDVQESYATSPAEAAYWIRLMIDNASGRAFSVTERDFSLTTILSRPENFHQFEVLSPHWRRIDSQTPKPIVVPPGASATLTLNWNEWVTGGLWIAGGAVREAGTWPPADESGKVWVRVNAAGFSTKPVSVPHPESIVAQRPATGHNAITEPRQQAIPAAVAEQGQVRLSLQFKESPWREVLQHLADELSLKLIFETNPLGTVTISELNITDEAAVKALNRGLWEQSLVIRRAPTELRITPRTLGDKLYTSSALFPTFVVVPDKSGNSRPPVTIAARDAVVHDPPKWLRDVPFPKLQFGFTRIQYDSRNHGSAWRAGYPEADLSISEYLVHHMGFAYEKQNTTMRLTDARLPEQSLIYIGNDPAMSLAEQEVVALRDYLLGGGFLVVDRSWGEKELDAFRQVMKRVLPTHDPKPLPMSHPIFHGVYDFQFKPQVPNYTDFGFAMRDVSVTSALRGDRIVPDMKLEPAEFYGFFDHERLMVLVCHNNDFMSGWRHCKINPPREQQFGHFSTEDQYTRQFGRSQAFPMALNVAYFALTQVTKPAHAESTTTSESVVRDLFDR
ncbi:MAG: DUF4159 domain-containing protein [Planctomycetales bacterium]|nr:DUF4159 domain-containing protein [Planctomycetales bacterium]